MKVLEDINKESTATIKLYKFSKRLSIKKGLDKVTLFLFLRHRTRQNLRKFIKS